MLAAVFCVCEGTASPFANLKSHATSISLHIIIYVNTGCSDTATHRCLHVQQHRKKRRIISGLSRDLSISAFLGELNGQFSHNRRLRLSDSVTDKLIWEPNTLHRTFFMLLHAGFQFLSIKLRLQRHFVSCSNAFSMSILASFFLRHHDTETKPIFMVQLLPDIADFVLV